MNVNWEDVFRRNVEWLRQVDWGHPSPDDILRLRKCFGQYRIWHVDHKVADLREIIHSPDFQVANAFLADAQVILARVATRNGLRFADLWEQLSKKGSPTESPDWFQLVVAASANCETRLSENAKSILTEMRKASGIGVMPKYFADKKIMNVKYARLAFKELIKAGFAYREGERKKLYLVEFQEF